MLSFLEKFFPALSKPLAEVDEMILAENGTEKQRYALARSEQTSQDTLYFLADNDPSVKVRRAVAGNPSTPIQAATVLASDKSEDVRMILARRLMVVLPSLSQDKYSQLYAFAVQALGDLALDEVLKVRRALAETLKDHAHTPPSVALQLAKDLERTVSEPILRFCTALSDDALIEVLQTHPAQWAAEAVAQRKTLSAPVSKAVIQTGNRKAGEYLLQNEGAEITIALLEDIVERAREYPEWHKPIASRAALPPLMAEKLAAYVDQSVRKILMERSDLDEHTIQKIAVIMQRRVKFQDEHKKRTQAVKDDKSPAQKAREFFDNNELTEELIGDALAMRDYGFVMESLALLAKAKPQTIQTVFDAKAPKSICAICWKAGFSMRFALQLQQTMGQVPAKSLVYPRGGTDYPFTRQEMEWQLDMIGIN